MKTTARRQWRWTLAVAVVAILATAGAAQAGQGVLYEVTEVTVYVDAKGNKAQSPDEAAYRMAYATLSGWVEIENALCPATVRLMNPQAQVCYIIASGVDKLDIRPTSPDLWKGTVRGFYTVVVQGDNPTDGAELVVQVGTFSGTMDLSARPLGTITGSFRPCTGKETCSQYAFRGTFRLPFTLQDGVAYYLADGGQSVIPVGAFEQTLGVPTVRLDLTFP